MDPYPYSMLQFEVTVGKDNDTPFKSTTVEWVNRIMIFCVCIVGRWDLLCPMDIVHQQIFKSYSAAAGNFFWNWYKWSSQSPVIKNSISHIIWLDNPISYAQVISSDFQLANAQLRTTGRVITWTPQAFHRQPTFCSALCIQSEYLCWYFDIRCFFIHGFSYYIWC